MITLTILSRIGDHYCLNSASIIKGIFFPFLSRSHPTFSVALNMAYWNKKLIYLCVDFKVAVSLDCPQAAGPPLSSHIT